MSALPAHPLSPETLGDVIAAVARQSRVATACFIFVSAALVAGFFLPPKVHDANMKLLVKRDRADSLVSGTPDSGRAENSEPSEPELLTEVELLQARDLLTQVVVETGLATLPGAGAASAARAQAIAEAISELRDDLTVAPIRKTWMIDVTYTSRDPRQAQGVLDTLLRLYLEKHLALHRPAGAYQFFVDQSDRSAADLRDAQTHLRAFRERNHVVSSSEQQARKVQQGAEFERLQRQTEVALAEANRRIAALTTEQARTPAQQISEVRSRDAGLVGDLQSRILTLELRRTELLQKYTTSYRLVTEIDQLLAQTRGALEEARRDQVVDQTMAGNPTMLWLENEIARARPDRAALEVRARSLRDTVATYGAQAQQLTTQEIEERELQRAVASAEERHLLYQRKREEARLSDALDRTRIANVVVADPPTLSGKARRPLSLVWLPLGLVGAMVLAVGAALATDKASHARTGEDRQLTLEPDDEVAS